MLIVYLYISSLIFPCLLIVLVFHLMVWGGAYSFMQISATSVCTVNPPTCSRHFLLSLCLTLLTHHYIFIPVLLYVFLKSNKTPDWVLRKPSPWSVFCQRVFTGLTLQLPSVVAMHPVSISLFLCSSVCTQICFKKALNDVKTTR